jgi:transcriptional regulator with XRE-family HTH domain
MVSIEKFLKELGQRIAGLRKDAELTQAQLAKKVGVSQQIIASYENGKRNFPIARLLELADALNVSSLELLAAASETSSHRPTQLDVQLAAVRDLPARKRQFVSEFLDTVLES